MAGRRIPTGLAHVRVSDENVDLRRFPDFMIIGPPRTGTDWLYWNLEPHPQIFLTVPKELHFFNLLDLPDHELHTSNDLSWYLSKFEETAASFAEKSRRRLRRFGEPYEPLKRGEATAAYACLDQDVIGEIHAFNPDLRVVTLVRDPVERAWSDAKRALARDRGRELDVVSDDELRTYFTWSWQLRCARTAEHIESWRRFFPPENVFVRRFEEIRTRPQKLLLELFEFLGVRSKRKYVTEAAARPLNATKPAALPPRHRAFLEELLGEEREKQSSIC